MATAEEPKPTTKKAGRPKGAKSKKTLVKEARNKAIIKAKEALSKSVKKKGKTLIDVTDICLEMGFDPISEAIILYREIEKDPFDLDGRKSRLDIIKALLPFYAPKKQPIQDTSTSRQVPNFTVVIEGAAYAPAPPPIEVHSSIGLPAPDIVDAEADEDK